MTDEIKVTQAGMSELIDRLRDAIQGIERILHDLDDEVADLRGSWDGAASDAYNRAHSKWSEQLNEMNGLLERHRSNTIASAELFADAVKENQKIWS